MFDLSLKAKVTSSAIIKHKFSLQINKKNLTSLLWQCLHIILKKLKTEYMNIWFRSTDYKTCLFGSFLMFFSFFFFFLFKRRQDVPCCCGVFCWWRGSLADRGWKLRKWGRVGWMKTWMKEPAAGKLSAAQPPAVSDQHLETWAVSHL